MARGHVERRLREELSLIITRLGHTARPTAGDGLSGELVDDAQVIELCEDQQLGRARLAGRAQALRVALGNLHAGTYGTCDECGEAIPTRRLRALPSATTCVPCQSRREEVRRRVARVVAGRRP